MWEITITASFFLCLLAIWYSQPTDNLDFCFEQFDVNSCHFLLLLFRIESHLNFHRNLRRIHWKSFNCWDVLNTTHWTKKEDVYIYMYKCLGYVWVHSLPHSENKHKELERDIHAWAGYIHVFQSFHAAYSSKNSMIVCEDNPMTSILKLSQ